MEINTLKEGVTLVDFWAEWCGPCKSLMPILNEIEEELKDQKFKIIKVNVDENPELIKQYDIMAIPSIFIFKDGNKVDSIRGFTTKKIILDLLKSYL